MSDKTYAAYSVEDYLAEAAAARPTPGGGSASALAGAAGAAMACMAANFTVGKKKYKDRWERVGELLAVCERARQTLLGVVADDAAAYAHVSAAYAMPKDTPEQKTQRTAAIQDALKKAMEPPMTAFVACADALAVLDELAGLANPNLVSDVGVAAALLGGALDGARLNVEINLAFLKDEACVAAARRALEQKGPPARDAARKTLDKVSHRITQ